MKTIAPAARKKYIPRYNFKLYPGVTSFTAAHFSTQMAKNHHCQHKTYIVRVSAWSTTYLDKTGKRNRFPLEEGK
jgi:hypothetical protein